MAIRTSRGGTRADLLHGSVRERLIAYKDLAKLDVFDAYLCVPLAWTLLDGAQAVQPRTIALLVLLLLFNVGYLAAASALDDVQGVRDGIDIVNYSESGVLRKRKRKPLLDHRLSERQALRFSWTCVAASLLAAAAAFALAGAEPWWFAPLVVGTILLAINYSWGLKLSYLGGQDFVVIFGFALNFNVMMVLLTGGLSWIAVVEGVLLGCWLMHVGSWANNNDREGDLQARRMTSAARLSERGAQRYTAGLYVLGWAVLVAGVATGTLPWWFLPLQIPALAMQIAALRVGIGERNNLAARLAAMRSHRLGWAGLAVANLILTR
ncbi:MAG TPA: prenyltransferase [Solirubrobacteraceae bacterium]|jgi:1,4-dihydroxy-2-naphthoate octaprenyltransferase|nr:prenyltransferase [Solirubrobacteraceae bacterium]